MSKAQRKTTMVTLTCPKCGWVSLEDTWLNHCEVRVYCCLNCGQEYKVRQVITIEIVTSQWECTGRFDKRAQSI